IPRRAASRQARAARHRARVMRRVSAADARSSTLLAQADLLGARLAHQAGRTHDENDDEDDEPDRLLERGIDVVTRKALHQADRDPADIGAGHAAEPTA